MNEAKRSEESISNDVLGPLPEPVEMDDERWGYKADDMREYAMQSIKAERQRFTTPEAMAEYALLYAVFVGAPDAATSADVVHAARLLFGGAAVDAALAKYRKA